VLRLDGLLSLLRWTQALAAFDASTDPGALVGELARESAEAARKLDQAADADATLRLVRAAEYAEEALAALGAAGGIIGPLLLPQLRARFAWAKETPLSRKQVTLARQALKGGAVQRAATLGFEAVVSLMMEEGRCVGLGNPSCNEDRISAPPKLNTQFKSTGGHLILEQKQLEGRVLAEGEAYYLLKWIRDALAHAVEKNKPALEAAFRDRESLVAAIEACLDSFFSPAPSPLAPA
jgi:hypothetical protein